MRLLPRSKNHRNRLSPAQLISWLRHATGRRSTVRPTHRSTLIAIGGRARSETSVPKAEIAFEYSFINVHPEYPKISSSNINGGGAAFVFNVTRAIGIKAEFMGYTGGGGAQFEKAWLYREREWNFFNYVFGPQIKKHSGRFQPFGEALFGAS
jgi:hypothetical protein